MSAGERHAAAESEHRPNGVRAHQLMPGSRLELFAGVGHFPQLERPSEFATKRDTNHMLFVYRRAAP